MVLIGTDIWQALSHFQAFAFWANYLLVQAIDEIGSLEYQLTSDENKNIGRVARVLKCNY